MENDHILPRKEIKTVGIVGCGPMGSAYTQVCALKGFLVVVSEINEDFMKKGVGLISSRLQNSVHKDEISIDEKDAILSRITTTINLNDMSRCDLVIESATENIELKKKIFKELDQVCAKDIVLGTNTSALSVLDLAMVTNRPDKVIGIHASPLIVPFSEIVKTILVSDETIEIAKNFVRLIVKDYAVVKDVPGGIISRLIRPFMLEAVRMLETGVAARDDIDKAFRIGLGWPLGPFQMLDVAGIDHFLRATDALYEEYKEAQYVPPTLLRKMATIGWLGVKTGKGFYEYGK